MPWRAQQTGQAPGPAGASAPLHKELVYTKNGRLGFLQSETAYTVTIELGPDMTLTLSKDDIDHRVRLI